MSVSTIPMPVKAKPYAHQNKAFDFACEKFGLIPGGVFSRGVALLMEMGTGKTITSIGIAGALYQFGKVRKILVVAPLSILGVWEEEFSKFAAFPYTLTVLKGPSRKKAEMLRGVGKDGLQIVVVNYESAWRIEKDILAFDADLIIADEAHKLKEARTSQSKAMHHFGDKARYKLLLTGTVITNRELDVFSQYRYLNRKVFGDSFYVFRNRYFDMVGYGNHIPRFRNYMLDEFLQRMHSISYRVTKEECLDLPGITEEIRTVELEPKAMKIYKELLKESYTELGQKEVSAVNVLTKLLRLSQVTGGHITDDEGDNNTVSTAKVDAFADILDTAIGVVIMPPVYDTIAASQMTLKSPFEFRKLGESGLKKLAAELCGEPLPSFTDVTDGRHFDELDPQDSETVRYGAADSDYTLRLYRIFNAWFDRFLPKHRTVVEEIESPTAVYLGIMKYNGVPIDHPLMLSRKAEAENEMARIKKEISFIIGDVDIGENCSTKAFKDYLFKTVGLPILKTTASDKEAADDMTMVLLKEWCDENKPELSQLFVLVQEYRKWGKIKSTYIDGYLRHRNNATGNLHPDLFSLSTDTGRMNCRNPNAQNMPRKTNDPIGVRSFIKAPDGEIKKITTIPAIKPMFSSQTTVEGRKRRVAAYARVSTDSDEQFTSFEAQVDYYTKYIAEHSEWTFVKVYADEGISGTSTKHRTGFNEMIKDALDGKIDLIVTKSISRFARNTIDTLTTVRQLKEKGIEVFFEKENIYTLDSKGELLITIMSSIAQEESRSISENVTWGQRKRFADGKVSMPYKHFLGYERGEDGKPRIVEAEAKIVRSIYRWFLEGLTPTSIAKRLTEKGVITPAGKAQWQNTTVESILKNEKYKGDALLQKKYTVDFLSKKQKVNEGEIPQYYVEGSHEGIVSAEVFDLVQYEFQRRKELGRTYSSISPFSSRLICGECGGSYGPKTWHSNDKYRREVYQCNHRHGKRSGEGLGCKTPSLMEDEIKTAFIGAFNSCIKNRKEIIENCKIAISTITDTTKLESQAIKLADECAVVTELIRKCVDENAHISIDPRVYAEKYEALAERYTTAKERLDAVETEIANRTSRSTMIAAFLDNLEKQDNLITDFDTGLWNTVIETMTIYSRERVVFKFKGGTEVEWAIS